MPVISFGESELYTTVNQLRHNHPIRRFQRKIEKSLGFTLPVAFGRGVFLPWGLLPYPVRLNIVVGAPIDVEKYTGNANTCKAIIITLVSKVSLVVERLCQN